MPSPLPRRSDSCLHRSLPSSRISLPRKGVPVGPRIVLFEVCPAFTHVTACTLAGSPFMAPLRRRLQPLRYLHDRSDYTLRLEPFRRRGSHPLESAAFSRRTPSADIARSRLADIETYGSRRKDRGSAAPQQLRTHLSNSLEALLWLMQSAALCRALGAGAARSTARRRRSPPSRRV